MAYLVTCLFRSFPVTVDSCTKSSLKLTLNDAAQDGIIYIQGQGAACKQLTVIGSNIHEFNFGACGIAWVSYNT